MVTCVEISSNHYLPCTLQSEKHRSGMPEIDAQWCVGKNLKALFVMSRIKILSYVPVFSQRVIACDLARRGSTFKSAKYVRREKLCMLHQDCCRDRRCIWRMCLTDCWWMHCVCHLHDDNGWDFHRRVHSGIFLRSRKCHTFPCSDSEWYTFLSLRHRDIGIAWCQEEVYGIFY